MTMFSISLLIKERGNDGGKINLSISLLIKERGNDAFHFFTHKGEEISL